MASDRFQRRLDNLLDQIEEAVDRRDWQMVRQLADDVLVLDPNNSDAAKFRAAAERGLELTPDLAPRAPQPVTSPAHPLCPAASAPRNRKPPANGHVLWPPRLYCALPAT